MAYPWIQLGYHCPSCVSIVINLRTVLTDRFTHLCRISVGCHAVWPVRQHRPSLQLWMLLTLFMFAGGPESLVHGVLILTISACGQYVLRYIYSWTFYVLGLCRTTIHSFIFVSQGFFTSSRFLHAFVPATLQALRYFIARPSGLYLACIVAVLWLITPTVVARAERSELSHGSTHLCSLLDLLLVVLILALYSSQMLFTVFFNRHFTPQWFSLPPAILHSWTKLRVRAAYNTRVGRRLRGVSRVATRTTCTHGSCPPLLLPVNTQHFGPSKCHPSVLLKLSFRA